MQLIDKPYLYDKEFILYQYIKFFIKKKEFSKAIIFFLSINNLSLLEYKYQKIFLELIYKNRLDNIL